MDAHDGKYLVKLARRAIEAYLLENKVLHEPSPPKADLSAKSGVFVTLKTYPEGRLRGCIGFPEPIKPLTTALVEAAISSATNDPRFKKIKFEDLNQITIEITVLTPPEKITVNRHQDYLHQIKIGRHGLIIEKGLNRGLLLPQVPLEQGWGVEEFLQGICLKAGLPPGSWKDLDSEIYRFEGLIFKEIRPKGEVVKE